MSVIWGTKNCFQINTYIFFQIKKIYIFFFKQTDGKLVKLSIKHKFPFFKTFYMSWPFASWSCILPHSQHALTSICISFWNTGESRYWKPEACICNTESKPKHNSKHLPKRKYISTSPRMTMKILSDSIYDF